MALEKRLACFVISSCSSLGSAAKASYLVPMRTGIAVCLSVDVVQAEIGNVNHLVETSRLTIPFLDAVQGRLARQIKHEEDGDGIVAH